MVQLKLFMISQNIIIDNFNENYIIIIIDNYLVAQEKRAWVSYMLTILMEKHYTELFRRYICLLMHCIVHVMMGN